MFYPVDNYPFLNFFRKNIDTISTEFFNSIENPKISQLIAPDGSKNGIDHYTNYWAKDNGFHNEQIGYDIRFGEYKPLAVYKKDFPIKHFDSFNIFPKTNEFLKTVPNLHFAAFVRMDSMSGLKAHTHNRKHLVFHLLLNDLENGESILTVENNQYSLKKKGDCLLFDYSYMHSVINNSDTTRYIFIVDFNPF